MGGNADCSRNIRRTIISQYFAHTSSPVYEVYAGRPVYEVFAGRPDGLVGIYPRSLLATRSRVGISAIVGFSSLSHLVEKSGKKPKNLVMNDLRSTALLVVDEREMLAKPFAMKNKGTQRRRGALFSQDNKTKKKAPVLTPSCVTSVGSEGRRENTLQSVVF